MGLLEFSKLPINTLVGADWKTFNAVTKDRIIDAGYKGKYRLTKAVCYLLSSLAPIQERKYKKKLADKPLEHDPVFILGHWRSGTTFVHNVFSCDKHFGCSGCAVYVQVVGRRGCPYSYFGTGRIGVEFAGTACPCLSLYVPCE